MNKDLIMQRLDYLFPDARCELDYSKDYELLLKVMLSAQTTDKRVNIATKELFEKYDTLEKLSKLSQNDVSNYIKSIGFHHTKSANFVNIVQELNKIGYVPRDRKYLESLSGVGRKTASVVLAHLFDEPSFAVDTHVYRVSLRLGIRKEKDDVLVCEKKLKKYFDKDKWNRVNSQLVLFGRYICKSQKPDCKLCGLNNICKRKKIID